MDAIIGILQNPVVLMLAGVAVKYLPKVREVVANRAITYINVGLAFLGAVLALLTGAVGSEIAPAVFASWYPEHTTIVTAGFGGAFGGLLGCFKSALWNAGSAYIMNKLLINQISITPPDSKG